MDTTTDSLTRRRFFAASSVAALTVGAAGCAGANITPGAAADLGGVNRRYQPDRSYPYEVRRTDAEWRAMLSDTEYSIMREGETEIPKSSFLWQETKDGEYHCKGCDLKVYDSRWKTIVDKVFSFFFHSEPNAVMTDIDGPNPAYGMNPNAEIALTEIHCRRCGCHLGHHLIVGNRPLHCINGTALNFRPS